MSAVLPTTDFTRKISKSFFEKKTGKRHLNWWLSWRAVYIRCLYGSSCFPTNGGNSVPAPAKVYDQRKYEFDIFTVLIMLSLCAVRHWCGWCWVPPVSWCFVTHGIRMCDAYFRWRSTINKQPFSITIRITWRGPCMIFVPKVFVIFEYVALVVNLRIDKTINLSDAEYHFSVFTLHPRHDHDEMPGKKS